MRRGRVRVLGQEPGRHPPRLIEQRTVRAKVGEAQQRVAALARAHELARAANLEVAARIRAGGLGQIVRVVTTGHCGPTKDTPKTATIEDRPGIPASPAHLTRVIHQMKEDRIKVIIVEPWNDLKLANRFRRLWSLYQQNQDLIQVGAYEAGSNSELDQAIKLRSTMENFLRQDMHISQDAETTRLDIQTLMAV